MTAIELPFYYACIKYSQWLITRNSEDLRKEFPFKAEDAANEVYAQEAQDITEAKTVIRSFILKEIRKCQVYSNDLEQLQSTKHFYDLEYRQCRKCGQVHVISEFVAYKDAVGFQSRDKNCRKCHNEIRRERESKPKYKEKARLRYLKFKAKHSNN